MLSEVDTEAENSPGAHPGLGKPGLRGSRFRWLWVGVGPSCAPGVATAAGNAKYGEFVPTNVPLATKWRKKLPLHGQVFWKGFIFKPEIAWIFHIEQTHSTWINWGTDESYFFNHFIIH